MSSTITIRLDDELKHRLEQLAAATHRSKSFLATEAIQEFLTLNEWQIQEIQSAIIEADAGAFVTDDQVANTFSQWGVNAN